MSTLQTSAHAHHRAGRRVGARFVAALAASIAIGAIALIIAVASSGHSGTTSQPTLARLTPQQHQYVEGIASLSQAQIAAAFGTGR